MTIYLDFDLTVNSEDFPAIGEPITGSIETIKELIDNNHRIILNTARIHFGINQLQIAYVWFQKHGIEPHGHTKEKLRPSPYQQSIQQLRYLRKQVLSLNDISFYIDDISEGIHTTIINGNNCVDWTRVRQDFLDLGVIKTPSWEQEKKVAGMYRINNTETFSAIDEEPPKYGNDSSSNFDSGIDTGQQESSD